MQSCKHFLALSLLALIIFGSAAAWAKEPFPQGTSWEDFLRDEEFVALNELHTQRNRFLTQFHKIADVLNVMSTAVDAAISSRFGDAVNMGEIIYNIQKSQITVAYVEYKILRRWNPRWTNQQAMRFFLTRKPPAANAMLLAYRQTLYRNHPTFRSKIAGERLGAHHFGEAPVLLFSNLLSQSNPKERQLLESVFDWMFQKWGSLPLPVEEKIAVPAPGPPPQFPPAKNLIQAKQLLSIAERQTRRLISQYGPYDQRVQNSRAEEEYYRREVQRFSRP